MVAVALQALKHVVGRTTREIAAIGLVGTWHSLLLLDKEKAPQGGSVCGRISALRPLLATKAGPGIGAAVLPEDWVYGPRHVSSV